MKLSRVIPFLFFSFLSVLTPFAHATVNYAQLIRMYPDDQERIRSEAVRIIEESTRIAKPAQEVLCYSKDNRRELKPIDLKSLVSGTLSLIETKIRNQNISLEIDIQNDIPEVVLPPQSI